MLCWSLISTVFWVFVPRAVFWQYDWVEIKERKKKKRNDFKLYESIEREGRMFGQFTNCAADLNFHFSEKYKQPPAVSVLKKNILVGRLTSFFARN